MTDGTDHVIPQREKEAQQRDADDWFWQHQRVKHKQLSGQIIGEEAEPKGIDSADSARKHQIWSQQPANHVVANKHLD